MRFVIVVIFVSCLQSFPVVRFSLWGGSESTEMIRKYFSNSMLINAIHFFHPIIRFDRCHRFHHFFFACN